MKPKINWKRFFLIIIIVTTIVSICVTGAVKLVDFLDIFKDGSGNVDGIDSHVKDGIVNCLIAGVDYEGLRTDVIMLASYNTKQDTIKVLSIPRDTRVLINNRYQKINAAHALKKINGTIEEVKKLTGMPIHYYVKLDFKGFRGVIDVLGKVNYNVPQRMYYVDPTQNLRIDLQPGMQQLDGNKAEQLVRFRSYPNGDITRIKVQQDFMRELVKQKLTPAIIPKLPTLFEEMSKYIQTNIGAKEVITYANILKTFSSEGFETYDLPGESMYIGPTSYYICDKTKTETLIRETFGYPDAKIEVTPVTAKDLAASNPINSPTQSPSNATPSPAVSASPKPTNPAQAGATPIPLPTPVSSDTAATAKPSVSPAKATPAPEED